MHNGEEINGAVGPSVFVNFTKMKRKADSNESEHNESNKNQRTHSDSDTISAASCDYDDLIVYSPESFDGDQSRDRFDKEIFLQFDNCYRSSLELPQCKECQINTECNKYDCRFFMFRKVERDSGRFRVVGYLENSDVELADLAIWTTADTSVLKHVDSTSRLHIVRCIASLFCDMTKEEKKVFEAYEAEGREKELPVVVAWKRAVYQVREMCDACATSIFNYHFVCENCGTIICIDCHKERKEGIVRWKRTKSEKDDRDKYYWPTCRNNDHHQLILTKMIPGDALTQLNESLRAFCDDQKIQLVCSCVDSKYQPIESSSNFQLRRLLIKKWRERQREKIVRSKSVLNLEQHHIIVKGTWVSNGNVFRFEGQQAEMTPEVMRARFQIFQHEWEQAKPVVVADVRSKLKSHIWTPDYFLENFGNIRHTLVNCQTDTLIRRVPLKDFWIGFKSYANRLPSNSQSNKLILKLKDWPDTEDFAELLQEHYNDFMNAIPFSSYTCRDGKFNLAKYQHAHFLKPDLGPKMYCAYGNFSEDITAMKRGSTNLHLDISDAVNILVSVSRPDDYKLAKKQYDKQAIGNALKLAGCSDSDLNAFMESERLAGAIWHMFHSRDVAKIRKVIREYAAENNIKLSQYEDPIHNQDWYVDVRLRRALEDKGVSCYTLIQYEGDCVFVPAKTPHQVTNIFDCIKIALDFVSPENVAECFNLTQEFRLLSTRHMNREDKLQIKSILYHTVKNLVGPKDAQIE